MSLINAAGGLYYHARAVRYGRKWMPFVEQVGAWLRSWDCPREGLLLVSPSGGYSLPDEWLSQFKQVIAFDVDPLARIVFERRHPRSKVTWHNLNCFPFEGGKIDWARLIHQFNRQPSYSVLFCNVLGQLEALAGHASEINTIPKSLMEIRHRLQERNWASYHDRFSSPYEPDMEGLTDNHLPDALLRESAYAWANPPRVEDHLTGQLGAGLPCHYMTWQRVPGYWHLIEACSSQVTTRSDCAAVMS